MVWKVPKKLVSNLEYFSIIFLILSEICISVTKTIFVCFKNVYSYIKVWFVCIFYLLSNDESSAVGNTH